MRSSDFQSDIFEGERILAGFLYFFFRAPTSDTFIPKIDHNPSFSARFRPVLTYYTFGDVSSFEKFVKAVAALAKRQKLLFAKVRKLSNIFLRVLHMLGKRIIIEKKNKHVSSLKSYLI